MHYIHVDQMMMKANVLIFNAPRSKTNLKEERVRIDMEFVGGLCNECAI